MNFESLLHEVQRSDGLPVVDLGHLDVLELDIKLKIHLTASQIEVYRQIYRLILVMSCDIKTAQDIQAPKLGKILPKSTFELRSAVPGLKAESGKISETSGKTSCLGILNTYWTDQRVQNELSKKLLGNKSRIFLPIREFSRLSKKHMSIFLCLKPKFRDSSGMCSKAPFFCATKQV